MAAVNLAGRTLPSSHSVMIMTRSCTRSSGLAGSTMNPAESWLSILRRVVNVAEVVVAQ